MKQAIIIANGRMEKPPDLASYIQASTLVIAADGGIHNCISLGIRPDIIIGDLDSMESVELSSYREADVDVIQYPTHKDETDLELALRHVMNHEISEVLILGGLGARWDMTIANILLLAHPMFTRVNMRLMDGTQELFLLHPNDQSIIRGHPGDIISLIPLTGDVTGIITNGLEYPLNNENLLFGTSRGVSNVFLKEQAQIFFKQGFLLCILNRAGS